MNIICFHNPNEPNGFLSNWYLADFVVNGIQFSSVEKYMMYKKASIFGDYLMASNILETDKADCIKQYGRSVSNYDDHIWSGIRQVMVYKGLFEKFNQNEELKRKLFMTGDSILAECAVKDRIWGIGLAMTDQRRNNIQYWNGQNLLGYSLMLVRSELKTQ